VIKKKIKESNGHITPNATRPLSTVEKQKELERLRKKQQKPEDWYKLPKKLPKLKELLVNIREDKVTIDLKRPTISEKDVDPKELAMGIRIEQEHTNDPKVARIIALHHLAEPGNENYYSKLKRMEKGVTKEPESPAEPFVSKSREIPSPTAQKVPEVKSDIPSLSQLAGREMGPPPLPQKQKVPQVPQKEPDKEKEKLPELPKFKDMVKPKAEKTGIGTDPSKINTQDWTRGKKVKIGFIKTPFTILGGDAQRGWVVRNDKGENFIFVGSKHPKLGRGLHKISGFNK
jgi:hypothetical protein